MDATEAANAAALSLPDLSAFGAVFEVADDLIVMAGAAFCKKSLIVRPLVRGMRLRAVPDEVWPAFVKAATVLASAKPSAAPEPPDPRLALGAAAVVSPTQAAQILPGRERENIRWLRESRLIRSRDGLPDVVIVGDILHALSTARTEPDQPSSVKPRPNLPRTRID